MSPGPEKAAPQEGHHDGDRREPGVAFEGESLANVSQIRQLGLTIMFGLVIWLIGLIGAGPQILAAQDQWLKIMPSFPAERSSTAESWYT
jgi:hypothetical protein